MRKPYSQLFDRLRRKYKRISVMEIHLVRGRYHVEYESDYEWIVGFCLSRENAEFCAEKLQEELKEVRAALAPSYANMARARRDYQKCRVARESQYFLEEYQTMDFIFRETLEKVLSTMVDKQIPWPYSQIMGLHRYNGPIEYEVESVPAVNSTLYMR